MCVSVAKRNWLSLRIAFHSHAHIWEYTGACSAQQTYYALTITNKETRLAIVSKQKSYWLMPYKQYSLCLHAQIFWFLPWFWKNKTNWLTLLMKINIPLIFPFKYSHAYSQPCKLTSWFAYKAQSSQVRGCVSQTAVKPPSWDTYSVCIHVQRMLLNPE